jgi:hypothetical protein
MGSGNGSIGTEGNFNAGLNNFFNAISNIPAQDQAIKQQGFNNALATMQNQRAQAQLGMAQQGQNFNQQQVQQNQAQQAFLQQVNALAGGAPASQTQLDNAILGTPLAQGEQALSPNTSTSYINAAKQTYNEYQKLGLDKQLSPAYAVFGKMNPNGNLNNGALSNIPTVVSPVQGPSPAVIAYNSQGSPDVPQTVPQPNDFLTRLSAGMAQWGNPQPLSNTGTVQVSQYVPPSTDDPTTSKIKTVLAASMQRNGQAVNEGNVQAAYNDAAKSGKLGDPRFMKAVNDYYGNVASATNSLNQQRVGGNLYQ